MPSAAAPVQAQLQKVVEAVYADLSFTANDRSGKLNTTRLAQAVNTVTGGVVLHNGSRIATAVPGESQAKFDQRLMALGSGPVPGAFYADGTPLTGEVIRRRASLMSVGDGKYWVSFDGAVAVTNGASGDAFQIGRPFVLDLTAVDLAQAPSSASPRSRATTQRMMRTPWQEVVGP
jgi:hypothetical protein